MCGLGDLAVLFDLRWGSDIVCKECQRLPHQRFYAEGQDFLPSPGLCPARKQVDCSGITPLEIPGALPPGLED